LIHEPWRGESRLYFTLGLEAQSIVDLEAEEAWYILWILAFTVFQPMCPRYVNVQTHRQTGTDGRLTVIIAITIIYCNYMLW